MKLAETEATTATKATKAMAVDITDNPTTITMTSTITITTNIMTIMAKMKLATTKAMAGIMNKIKIKVKLVEKEELEVNIKVRILKIIIITTRIINQVVVDIKITITLGTEVSRIKRIKTLMKIELIITKGEMIKNNNKMTTKDINHNKISKNKPLPSSLTLTDQKFKLHKVNPSLLLIGTQTQ
jgi:hypothetical protein